jgi:site-specific recombinase XerD
MRRERIQKELAPDQPVLRIKECLGFLTSACEKINLERLTHHDLRHLFATTAIEQNIDVPSVAALLGHSDGGALAMKVYGHSRQEHLRTAVDKLKFGLNSC